VTLFQPKGSVTIGPFAKTEVYFSVGRGFHSNDIRSVSGTVLLENVPGFAQPTPLLVRVDSEEVGLRSDRIPLTHLQFAAFLLHVGSEQIYDQDQGEDVPGAPSRRYGFELSGQVHPRPWLELNADLSYSHARFNTAALAIYGDAGPYIPNAPAFVGSFGILVDSLGPWFGGVQVRVLGAYPLVSDDSARDHGYTETNARIGYKFSSRLRAQVEVFNLFDVHANAGAFYYTTVIPGDNGVPTADHQNHALEPISARFSVTTSF
jgi:outer membrane receptor protein involved in Fe transport